MVTYQARNSECRRRKLVLDSLREECSKLRDAKVRVIRGGGSWAAWPWDKYPFGIFIVCDDSTIMVPEGRQSKITVTLEMMQKMPDDFQEIDENLSEQLYDEAISCFKAVSAKRHPADVDWPVIQRIIWHQSVCLETSDDVLKVQGITATVPIEF